MSERGASRARLLLALLVNALGVWLLALAPSCLERRDEPAPASDSGRCAQCHGDPRRAGDFLQRAAPPADLAGNSAPGYPGVGAHAVHSYAGATHGAVACRECHRVPATVQAVGHADDALPAELEFGRVASQGPRSPSYDFATRRCSDGYCHGSSGAGAVWTSPRSSQDACGSCHGLPPPAPHPRDERCSACHGQVVTAERNFLRPELHVNGVVELAAGSCTSCHGSGGDPAPPLDTLGNSDTAAIGVGAHRAHLSGGRASRPLACQECHSVPESADAPGHADALPAEVVFSGVALTDARTPAWDRAVERCNDSFCHGPSPASSAPSAKWTEAGPLGCTSCHGNPPAPPHPQFADCARCHGEVIASDNVNMRDRKRHVNGVVDVSPPQSCTACHGGANSAPPSDLAGNTDTNFPGVGAHQIHRSGTPRSRQVPCGACHVVPLTLLSPGHVDSDRPAELKFSGAAVAFGAGAGYSVGSCQNTSCHGAVFPNGHASGGTNTTPLWTKVDGSQASCGSCHSLPPPAPHPRGDLNPVCNACHQNIAPDNQSFTRPELHVDGRVTFTLP